MTGIIGNANPLLGTPPNPTTGSNGLTVNPPGNLQLGGTLTNSETDITLNGNTFVVTDDTVNFIETKFTPTQVYIQVDNDPSNTSASFCSQVMKGNLIQFQKKALAPLPVYLFYMPDSDAINGLPGIVLITSEGSNPTTQAYIEVLRQSALIHRIDIGIKTFNPNLQDKLISFKNGTAGINVTDAQGTGLVGTADYTNPATPFQYLQRGALTAGFSVSGSNSIQCNVYFHNLNQNYIRIDFSSTGCFFTRNIADANPVVRINQSNIGSTGDIVQFQFNSVVLGKVDAKGNVAGASVRGGAVTFANLPAAPVEGMLCAVTDSTVNTWGTAIAGGGTNHILAYYNGTAWTCAGK